MATSTIAPPPGFDIDPAPKATPAPPDGFVQDSAPAPPPGFQMDAAEPAAPRITAEDLAKQDNGAIAAHAAQNPEDFETAYQADKMRRNRPFLSKAGEFIKSSPAALWHGVQGLGRFAAGAVETPLHALEWWKPSETKMAENTLAAQHGEQAITNAGNAIMAARPGVYNGGWGENTGEIDTRTPEDMAREEDNRQRALFSQRVQQAKNELQLSRGEPLDTGAIAGIYHLAGQQPSEEVGPAALKATGVPQADQGTVGRMSAASDPTMLALAAAPGLPGAATIGGGATELAGKAMSGVGNVVSATSAALSPLKVLRRIANPASIATDAAKEGGARGLQALGDILQQQGKELRTGAPSPLTTAAATAEATGEGAIGTNLKRALGDAAAKGASTAVGMAPLNALLSEGDPHALSESTVGAGVFGGALGAFQRVRPMMVEAVRPFLRSEGARALAEAGEGNDPLAAKSAAYVMSLTPEARDQTLEAIGSLQGLPATQGANPQRAKLYVLNADDYQKAIEDNFGKEQAASGGGRGFFLNNEGTAFINGEYHSGLDPSEMTHTIGHEFGGHAAINIMRAAGARGGMLHQGLMDAARQALFIRQPDAQRPYGTPSPDFKRFVDAYNLRFDPTGQTQRLDWRDPEAIEEFLSEQAGQQFAAKGAGELALPKSIQDRINDNLGRFLGSMVGVDTRKIGTDTHFSREEVGSLSQTVEDTLRQVVGMKLREGAEIPEPAKTTQTRINELNATLAKPRPATGAPLEEMRAWIAEQAAARKELSQLQGSQSATFPASGQAPVPPSAPQAPNVPATAPAPSRASVAAALRINGIPSAEAQQWAQQAQGNTVEEMILDALKRRAGQKFPSQPPAAQTPPNQPTVIPPAEKTPANEQPAPTPNENGTLPPGRTGVQEQTGQGVAPTQPVEVATPEHLDQIAAQAREQFLADKEPAKSGKNKGQHTAANQKAADKAAFDAAAAAHAEAVPENYQGLRQRTDTFGQKSVSGTVDPSRPFDAWLIKQAMDSGHLTPDSLKTLLTLQDSIGKTVSYDYGHAPVADEGDMPTKGGRAAAQAESSVADRLAGGPMQTERKTSVPLRVGYNSGTKSFTVYGVSQEKLLNNFNHITEKMGDLGIPNPFRDINDPRFVAAFKAIIRNQEHGWTGDGKSPSVGTEEFPNTPDPDWKNSPEHQIVPDDQFQFVNALLADEGAKPPKRGDATVSKAKAHLANENERLLNAEGETNPLRQKINSAEPGWTKATLEDPVNENISPALASNIGGASQSDESIRQHGKVGDIARFFDKGQTPNRAKVAAGFLPDTGDPKTAKERAEDRMNSAGGKTATSFMPDDSTTPEEGATPSGQRPSGSQPDRLSTGGTSPKDTGKPEEGETPGERLMREAEAAGLAPSLETTKGILRGNTQAMDKLRRMILDKTGRPARFMPGTNKVTIRSLGGDGAITESQEEATPSLARELARDKSLYGEILRKLQAA